MDAIPLSPAAARAKAHYAGYLGDNRQHIAVPEWGDDLGAGEIRPLIIYWKPLTLAERARAFAVEAGSTADTRANAKLVFFKAEDAAGKRLFSEPADLHVLQAEAVEGIVLSIASAMAMPPSVSEAVEKLRGNAFRVTMFQVADRLGKTIEEIEQMSVAAFTETLAFYKLKEEQE